MKNHLETINGKRENIPNRINGFFRSKRKAGTSKSEPLIDGEPGTALGQRLVFRGIID